MPMPRPPKPKLDEHPKLDRLDRRIALWMGSYGHFLHRVSLGGMFVWFGALKLFEIKTTTSLLAHTVYWGSPEVWVPILGVWEVLIGVGLLSRSLLRAALLLLAVRLPGTLLALVLHADVCFVEFPYAPSPEGQYLIKDLLLFSAAMVIGGTVRWERDLHPKH